MNSEKQSTSLQMILREVNRVGEGKKNVPKLRFKGYEDAWEQRKLGEVFEQTVEYVNPKLENIELWSVTVESGLTPKTERYNREALVKKEDKFKLVHPGDVVYNPMNMTIGAVGMNQQSNSIAVSGYYVTMRLRENFIGFYFFEWLSSDRAMNLFRNHATGSLIEKQRVQFPTLSNIDAYVPEFLEQKNIGQFFQRLDKLITLHQRKYDALKTMKKTLLSKMFPKDGEDVPEIRFKGFTDAWEQRKLGEVSQIVGGGTPSTGIPEYWDGDIDWYSPAEIGEDIFVSCSQRKITQLGLEKSSAKILPVGTVLFTSRAGIGNTAILEKEGCTNQGFQSIVPKDNELDSYFIFSCSHLLKKYGETKGAGSTFVEISGKQMSLMPLNIPEIKEQKSVGNFFRKLDNLITLHQRKLEELKNMKKTLLQQMFV